MALEYAKDLDERDKFYSIHSKREGEVGRVILGTKDDHMRQLLSYDEHKAYVGQEAQAHKLDRLFKNICQKQAQSLGIRLRAIEETEIIKNEPKSWGQVEHMDAMGGVWNFFAPLVKCSGTKVKAQVYQDYPKNIGPESTVPRNWSTMPDVHINWTVGDLFLLRSNAIHGGPPNGATRRYVLFASERSLYPSEHSDTIVVTEKEFFSHKQKKQKKWASSSSSSSSSDYSSDYSTTST